MKLILLMSWNCPNKFSSLYLLTSPYTRWLWGWSVWSLFLILPVCPLGDLSVFLWVNLIICSMANCSRKSLYELALMVFISLQVLHLAQVLHCTVMWVISLFTLSSQISKTLLYARCLSSSLVWLFDSLEMSAISGFLQRQLSEKPNLLLLLVSPIPSVGYSYFALSKIEPGIIHWIQDTDFHHKVWFCALRLLTHK